MVTALALFAAWTLGALAVAYFATRTGWPPVPTVLLATGAVLLPCGAILFLPGVIEALRKVNFSAPPGPYGDTHYVVGQGHLLISLGLIFLFGAAIALWIARKGGRRTRKLLTVSAVLFHVAIGAQLAVIIGVIPEIAERGFDNPDDFSRINLALVLVSQVAFLASLGVLVCSVLTVRRMFLR